MKKKLIFIAFLFSMVIILVTGVLYFKGKQIKSEDVKAEQVIALNEISQLAKAGETDKVQDKAEELKKNIRYSQNFYNNAQGLFLLCGVSIIFIIFAFGYLYFSILKPFDKMKQFAEQISKGDFDIRLDFQRSNYFGEFTWAFDSMRREITKARLCEREAIENNKTVIATLSHDIKTPISSIRAYAEGLEANMDKTPQNRQKYLGVIMKKCDEVSRLTNDLFLHSLSDLDKLKVSPVKFEICRFMEEVTAETGDAHNDINYTSPEYEAWVMADKNRMMQIAENIINNTRKYAKSHIDIFIVQSGDDVEIHFRDYGEGIPDEDMPFIFDKFYRGKNCGDEQGSGLGLYIVKYIITKMDGTVIIHNHVNGVEIVIRLPVICL